METSAILDEKRRIVLFYRACPADPAWPCGNNPEHREYFRTATEIEGSDGTRFVVDEGDRLTIQTAPPYTTATNPDVFRDRNGFVLYVGQTAGSSFDDLVRCIVAYSSKTLRGQYSKISGLPDGKLVCGKVHPSATGHYDFGTDSYWTYLAALDKCSIVWVRHRDIHTPLALNDFRMAFRLRSMPDLGSSFIGLHTRFAVNEP